jgi:hypothetical protein
MYRCIITQIGSFPPFFSFLLESPPYGDFNRFKIMEHFTNLRAILVQALKGRFLTPQGCLLGNEEEWNLLKE